MRPLKYKTETDAVEFKGMKLDK